MSTLTQNTITPAPERHDTWQPRPELLEAMRRIATIADGDETAVISGRSRMFQNLGETTIKVDLAPH